LFAVQRLGENARHRRFARPARSAEQVPMANTPLRDFVVQHLHNGLLSDDITEELRAIAAGEDLVVGIAGHAGTIHSHGNDRVQLSKRGSGWSTAFPLPLFRIFCAFVATGTDAGNDCIRSAAWYLLCIAGSLLDVFGLPEIPPGYS